ncbi:hypothetical protein JD969_13745 [Planctomycetota bacterium]|nr:hypothetical protein JD969_13745 [Planctomycetota bacterium]
MKTSEAKHKLPPNTYASTRKTDALYYAYRTIRYRPVLYPECRHCHYPINNLTTNTCPECGTDLSAYGYLKPQSEFPVFLNNTFTTATILLALTLIITIFTTHNKVYDHYYKEIDIFTCITQKYGINNTKPRQSMLVLYTTYYAKDLISQLTTTPIYSLITFQNEYSGLLVSPIILDHTNKQLIVISSDQIDETDLSNTLDTVLPFLNLNKHNLTPLQHHYEITRQPITSANILKIITQHTNLPDSIKSDQIAKPLESFGLNPQHHVLNSTPPFAYTTSSSNILQTNYSQTHSYIYSHTPQYTKFIKPIYYLTGVFVFIIYYIISRLIYRRLALNFDAKHQQTQ